MPVFLLLRRHLLTSSSSTRQAYHHYLKVVTTNIEGLVMGRRQLKAYQIIQSSQLAYYRNDVVPEAKVNALAGISLTGEIIIESQPPASCRGKQQFIFDLSPIAVNYDSMSRHWYDYITSIMAIVGGTFTVVGLIESSIYTAVSKRPRYS
jgi:hypothetical protein